MEATSQNFFQKLLKNSLNHIKIDQASSDYENMMLDRIHSHIDAALKLIEDNFFIEAPIIYRAAIESVAKLHYFVNNKHQVTITYPDFEIPMGKGPSPSELMKDHKIYPLYQLLCSFTHPDTLPSYLSGCDSKMKSNISVSLLVLFQQIVLDILTSTYDIRDFLKVDAEEIMTHMSEHQKNLYLYLLELKRIFPKEMLSLFQSNALVQSKFISDNLEEFSEFIESDEFSLEELQKRFEKP